MTNHSTDSADENTGKHSTDQQMTFDSLLKASLKERDGQERMSSSPAENRQSSDSKSVRKTSSTLSETAREESTGNQHSILATSIGEAHASGQFHTIADGDTKAIGHYTTYELASTEVNDDVYYYLAQITDKSYERHHAQLAIKDFGTTWSFKPPEVNPEAIQQAISEQRQRDLRAGKEPVEWLTDAQINTISDWYPNRIKWELRDFKRMHNTDENHVHVIGQYLVADINREALLIGNELQALTDRQLNVTLEQLVDIIDPNIDILPALDADLRERFEYPLLAKITFPD